MSYLFALLPCSVNLLIAHSLQISFSICQQQRVSFFFDEHRKKMGNGIYCWYFFLSSFFFFAYPIATELKRKKHVFMNGYYLYLDMNTAGLLWRKKWRHEQYRKPKVRRNHIFLMFANFNSLKLTWNNGIFFVFNLKCNRIDIITIEHVQFSGCGS